MIEEISIEGLGVIDSTRLSFGPGLTAVTGETGAGKSMLLESLGLLMGNRADTTKVRHGHKAAVVDGIFTVADQPHARRIAEDAGALIDDDNLIYISRRVMKEGGSRAYLSGRPVPAGVLSELKENLVTVHGQADQHRLVAAASQREFLDSFGGKKLGAAVDAYRRAYEEWKDISARARQWNDDSQRREEEVIRLREGIDAIDDLDVVEDEDTILKNRIERLMNSEDLRLDVGTALQALSGSDDGVDTYDVTSLLATAREHVDSAHQMDPVFEQVTKDLAQVDYIVQDIATTLADYIGRLDADPHQLQADHERLAKISTVLSGRAENVRELLVWRTNAEQRLAEIDNPDNSAEAWKEKVDQSYERMRNAAAALTGLRKSAAAKLSAQATQEIHDLAMPDATLSVEVRPREEPATYGMDDVVFLLQPHHLADAQNLGKAASGGELSRIMLALEVCAIGAQSGDKTDICPTLVFDEIDSGIGGHTARLVAQRLSQLAQSRQVIVVTHLPQVAAYALTHVLVSKDGDTTDVRVLDSRQREQEIARMLSGDDQSDTALEHARELLQQASAE